MSKLKIGYWPLSQTLTAAGDRRRLIFWANARGHAVFTDLNQKVDVIVASENSDFNSSHFNQNRVPIIFDLIDAYLSPLNLYDDLARGIAKKLSRNIRGEVKPFSHHIRDFCAISTAVICSSIEQEALINEHNSNTHVILDSHDEIPILDPIHLMAKTFGLPRVLWEGQPATIQGVKQISPVLSSLLEANRMHFDFVTDEKYFQFLNKYVRKSTKRLLLKDLGRLSQSVSIIPWTPDNLVAFAKKSTVAMIPIDLSVPMQRLKPENRLLIMWRLGLPCLTSASLAYARVASSAGVNAVCENHEVWFENFNRLLNDSKYALNEIRSGQNYLHENHTKSILLKKWDIAFESVMS